MTLLALMVPLAHAGHWLPYLIPAAVILIAVVISTIRERSRRESSDAKQSSSPES